jgi:hypothetical protein
MGSNAGFGIVVNLSQDVINSTIAAYWSALATSLNYQLPPNVEIAGEIIAFDATLQFLTPTIALAPNPNNLIATTLGCGGFLSFSIGATAPTTVVLSLTTTISAAVQVADQAGYFVPSLDLSNAVVSDISVTVVQGPTLPDVVNQALNSPDVLGGLQTALRAIPANLLSFGQTTVPDQISASGVTVQFGNVVVVPMTGLLVVAADLIGYTTGNAAQLVSLFTAAGPNAIGYAVDEDGTVRLVGGGFGTPGQYSNVAATVNGSALMAVMNGPVTNVLKGLSLPAGASITSANFSIGYYQRPLDNQFWPGITVTVSASDFLVLAGSITINFGVYSQGPGSGDTGWLSRQGPPTWNLRAENVTISAGIGTEILAGTLIGLLGVIFPAFAPLIAVALIAIFDGVLPGLLADFETAAQNAVNGVLSSSSSFGASEVQTQTGSLPGASNTTITVDTQGLVISSDGIDSYCAVTINPPDTSPSLTLNGTVPDGAYSYGDNVQAWTFQIVLPSSALNQFPTFISLTDPTIHVAWAVSGTNVDGSSFSSDQLITVGGALQMILNFDPNSTPFANNNGLTITATLYRLLAGSQLTLWTGTIKTTISDILDVTQRYVQWSHIAYFTVPNPAGGTALQASRNRKSVLHKTGRGVRCKNVETAAAAALPKNQPLTYTNTLPFPADQAQQNRRGVLCDYCFFKGPHGTVFVP